MKPTEIAGIFLIFAMSLQVPTALAAPSKKMQHTPETYSAFEADMVGSPVTAPVSPQKSPAPSKATANSTKGGYELVPSTQAEPIIHRLKIVEELIRKYGRAYDYRIYTLKELQSILNQLEGSHPSQLPVPPAPLSSDEPPVSAPTTRTTEPGETLEPTHAEAPREASPAFSPNVSAETL